MNTKLYVLLAAGVLALSACKNEAADAAAAAATDAAKAATADAAGAVKEGAAKVEEAAKH